MESVGESRPVVELVLGLVILTFIIFVHGVGIRTIYREFSRAWVGVEASGTQWRVNLILATTVASMAGLHLVETLLWALPISQAGLIPSLRDSYFYVLESYTTLGEGNVALPEKWRLVGPMIAMSGLFTFGWTGSVLVNIMTEFGKFDRVQARKDKDAS
ncbi:ion channel [Aestuariivirga sp.]|uniref:ion channel n=1 Tax=Aestuariivirga sp. TaxID=2650926 RepID=UPI003593EF1B